MPNSHRALNERRKKWWWGRKRQVLSNARGALRLSTGCNDSRSVDSHSRASKCLPGDWWPSRARGAKEGGSEGCTGEADRGEGTVHHLVRTTGLTINPTVTHHDASVQTQKKAQPENIKDCRLILVKPTETSWSLLLFLALPWSSSPRLVLRRAAELTLAWDNGSGELRHDGKRSEAGPDVLDVRYVGRSGWLCWGCGRAAELSAALEGKDSALQHGFTKERKKKKRDLRRGSLGNRPEWRCRCISGCVDGPGCGTCCVSTVEASAAVAADLEVMWAASSPCHYLGVEEVRLCTTHTHTRCPIQQQAY